MSTWEADHPVTSLDAADPRVEHLQRFPVKSLDPETPDSVTLVTDGAVAGDRQWAVVDRPPEADFDPAAADVGGSGDYVNGKKTAQVQRLRSTFHRPESGGPAVTIRRQDEPPADARRFDLWDGSDDTAEATVHEPLDDWLSTVFDRPVSVRRAETGQQDDRERHGPTIVSTATLREVGAWFDVGLDSARRRFRATIEVGGVPPFWEDRLFGDEGEAIAVRLGDAVIHGLHPCQRCVVPGRDPDTGAETPNFRETFVERRRATRPEWTDSDRYDHDFRLMVNTDVPDAAAGKTVSLGESVERVGVGPV